MDGNLINSWDDLSDTGTPVGYNPTHRLTINDKDIRVVIRALRVIKDQIEHSDDQDYFSADDYKRIDKTINKLEKLL